MLYVSKLTICGKTAPMGLDDDPVFRLAAVSDESGTVLTAAQIQVARKPEFTEPTVWDSGRAPRETSDIPYGGPKLTPHTRYYARAKVWSEEGGESAWSEPAVFDTGFYKGAAWQGKFISADLSDEKTAITPCVQMARDFALDEPVILAKLHVAARGMYELFLNGKRVGEDRLVPGFVSYNKFLIYQSHDVTDLLNTGGNRLLALMGDGWYKGNITSDWHRNYYGDKKELLAELHITLKNGKKLVVATDEQFVWWYSPVLLSEIYDGEIYDARLEKPGCELFGFKDGDFRPVSARADTGVPIVYDLGNPVRIVERITPKAVLKTPAGETVIDMGKNFTGTVAIRVRGKAGDGVVLKCGEVLDVNGNFYTRNLEEFVMPTNQQSPSVQNIRYTLSGRGEETFTPHFTYQGFRYVKVIEFPGEAAAECFEGVVLSSFDEQTGFFTCSHPGINQLFENILTCQRGNFISLPIAGAQRAEGLGWTGDGHIFAPTACLTMDAQAFYRQWLQSFIADQRENGDIPLAVPFLEFYDITGDVDEFISTAGWGDAVAIIPWLLYEQYGDVDILHRMYPTIKRFINYLRQAGDNEFLYNEGRHFGDWFAIDGDEDAYTGQTDTEYFASAFYAYSALLASKIAGVIGKAKDAYAYMALYRRVAAEVGKAFARCYTNPESATQTGCVMALKFGIAAENGQERQAVETLLKLLENKNNHLDTGFLGTAFLCEELTEHGRADIAYKLLTNEDYPSWLYTISRGATSIWEHWNNIKPDGSYWSAQMNSFSHTALGSIGKWLFTTVCGITPAAPGYKRFVVAPVPGGGLSYAKASIETPYGKIESGWYTENGLFTLDVSVPADTWATVILPCAADTEALAAELSLRGYAVITANEVVRLTIGSGDYTFSYSELT